MMPLSAELKQLLRDGKIKDFNLEREKRHVTDPRLDLTDEDFSNIDIRNANLSSSVFKRSKLKGIITANTNLSNSVFVSCDWSDVKFIDSNLSGCIFEDNEKSSHHSLLEGTFPRCDLSHAVLPKHISFEGVRKAEEISKIARTLFYLVIAGSIYGLVQSWNIQQLDLFDLSREAPLPFVNLKVPLKILTCLMPLFILAIYLYFLIYVKNLWEELGSLPKIFPDGRTLSQKTHPWIINDLACSFAKCGAPTSLSSKFKTVFTISLLWGTVPLICLGIYISVLRYCAYPLIFWQILATSITFCITIISYKHAKAQFSSECSATRKQIVLIFVSLLFFLMVPSVLVTQGCIEFLPTNASRTVVLLGKPAVFPPSLDLRSRHMPYMNAKNVHFENVDFSGSLMTHVDFSAAKLDNINFSDSEDKITRLNYANFNKSTLSNSSFRKASLVGAKLKHVKLHKVDFSEADMRGVTTFTLLHYIPAKFFAAMRSVNFRDTQLKEWNISNIDFTGSNFKSCKSNSLKIMDATLDACNFSGCYFEGIDVSFENSTILGADFTKGTVKFASFKGSTLSGSKFESTVLSGTNFENDTLDNVDFSFSILDKVYFQKCKLRGTIFSGASLCQTVFDNVDLSGCTGLEFDQIKVSIITESTILPPKLEARRNEFTPEMCVPRSFER